MLYFMMPLCCLTRLEILLRPVFFDAERFSSKSALFGRLVTTFRVILRNKMFLRGKMTIYINCSD